MSILDTLVTSEPPKFLNKQSGLVRSWSFTRLMKFADCPYRVFLESVRKIKEQQTEQAARGDNIHHIFEDYIQGKLPSMPKQGLHIADQLDEARHQWQTNDTTEIEEMWLYDQNWETMTDPYSKLVWARIKLDAFWRIDDSCGVVRDWKSGKKMGNEVKHTKQLQIYSIAAFLRYPGLNFIEASMEYCDQASKNRLVKTYTREQAMRFFPSWDKQATILTTCQSFRPCPSQSNCAFCPFSRERGKNCEFSF